MCNKLAKSQKFLSWRKLVTFTEKTCWDTKRLLKYKINTIDVLKLQIVKGTCTNCPLSFSLCNLIYSFRPVYKFTWYGVIKVIVVELTPCLLKLRSYDLRLEEVLYKSDIEKNLTFFSADEFFVSLLECSMLNKFTLNFTILRE